MFVLLEGTALRCGFVSGYSGWFLVIVFVCIFWYCFDAQLVVDWMWFCFSFVGWVVVFVLGLVG